MCCILTHACRNGCSSFGWLEPRRFASGSKNSNWWRISIGVDPRRCGYDCLPVQWTGAGILHPQTPEWQKPVHFVDCAWNLMIRPEFRGLKIHSICSRSQVFVAMYFSQLTGMHSNRESGAPPRQGEVAVLGPLMCGVGGFGG